MAVGVARRAILLDVDHLDDWGHILDWRWSRAPGATCDVIGEMAPGNHRTVADEFLLEGQRSTKSWM